jgi:hypothetical protein
MEHKERMLGGRRRRRSKRASQTDTGCECETENPRLSESIVNVNNSSNNELSLSNASSTSATVFQLFTRPWWNDLGLDLAQLLDVLNFNSTMELSPLSSTLTEHKASKPFTSFISDSYLPLAPPSVHGPVSTPTPHTLRSWGNRSRTLSELECWYTNPTSMGVAKMDEIPVRLRHATRRPQAIFIAETWFDSSSIVDLPGYSIFRSDRGQHGGGVALFVAEELVALEVEDEFLTSRDVEQIWASVKIGSEHILIGCIYRPQQVDPSKVFPSLRAASRLVKNNKYTGVILAGDFNMRRIK